MATKEQSVFEAHFLDTVRAWFVVHYDIFVVVRYSAMTGAREYFWFKDFGKFQAQLKCFPPQANVIVFRDKQFPLRGIVTDTLIRQALDLIPDNTEAMVANIVQPPDDSIYVWPCDTHAELTEALHDLRGEYAAIGLYPPWHMPDNENMISALVPLPDGTLKRGVY
jgi:hypothetical protein